MKRNENKKKTGDEAGRAGAEFAGAVGDIDEEYIAEAMDWSASAARTPRPAWRRAAVAAAVAAVLLIPSLILLAGPGSARYASGRAEQAAPGAKSYPQAAVYDAADAGNVSAREPSTQKELLYCGRPSFIWKTEAGYFYSFVSDEDAVSLRLEQTGAGISSGPSGRPFMWLCDGRGTVTTPFLPDTEANRAEGELFGYVGELELTAGAAAIVDRLMSSPDGRLDG